MSADKRYCEITPQVQAIHAWIRDDAPLSMKMIITPKLVDALLDRLEALQPSPETSLQNMQTREAPRREEESLYPLLASAWFYGGWKAETHNERKMQAVMEQAGWWPIANESELLEKLSSSPTVEGGEETLDVGEKHELECLRNQVQQLAYPCSPHCAGYLRELAAQNTAAKAVRLFTRPTDSGVGAHVIVEIERHDGSTAEIIREFADISDTIIDHWARFPLPAPTTEGK